MKSKMMVILLAAGLVFSLGCPKKDPAKDTTKPPAVKDRDSQTKEISKVDLPPVVSEPEGAAPPSAAEPPSPAPPPTAMTAPMPGSHSRTPAPDFALPALDGKEYKLSDFRGKVVVLCFWSTRCGHCLNTVPTLEKFKQAYKGKPVMVISVTQGDPAQISALVGQLGLTFPVLLDDDFIASDAYGVEYVPTNVIIAPDGGIEVTDTGAKDYMDPAVRNVIDQLLREIS